MVVVLAQETEPTFGKRSYEVLILCPTVCCGSRATHVNVLFRRACHTHMYTIHLLPGELDGSILLPTTPTSLRQKGMTADTNFFG